MTQIENDRGRRDAVKLRPPARCQAERRQPGQGRCDEEVPLKAERAAT